jgi:hypothetical protein
LMGNACSPPRASDPKVGADHITLLGGSIYQLASNPRRMRVGAFWTRAIVNFRVIGINSDCRGVGIGSQPLKSFCDLSATDPQSEGVYLERAKELNLRFNKFAGLAEAGHGSLGKALL